MENSNDQSQKGKELFLTMVGLLGLETEVHDKISGKSIILSVKTDEPGRLIGRNGSSLDCIGLLMNRILKKDDFEFPKVIIDVDGYEKKKPKKRRRNQRERSRKIDKTIAFDDNAKGKEESSGINFYVEEDAESLEPITTVALDKGKGSGGGGHHKGGRNNRSQTTKMNRNKDREPRAAKPSRGSSTQSNAKPSMPPNAEKGAGKKGDRLQMQCRNAAKEVKRWGEEILLPPMVEDDCQKVLDYFKSEKEINASISDRNYGDKKRVRISLKS